jgi:hypothetical protein
VICPVPSFPQPQQRADHWGPRPPSPTGGAGNTYYYTNNNYTGCPPESNTNKDQGKKKGGNNGGDGKDSEEANGGDEGGNVNQGWERKKGGRGNMNFSPCLPKESLTTDHPKQEAVEGEEVLKKSSLSLYFSTVFV